jgi:hypothetical protein
MKAKALFALGKTKEGLDALDKAIEIDPEWDVLIEEKKKHLASN